MLTFSESQDGPHVTEVKVGHVLAAHIVRLRVRGKFLWSVLLMRDLVDLAGALLPISSRHAEAGSLEDAKAKVAEMLAKTALAAREA
jgi:hypothetical protein